MKSPDSPETATGSSHILSPNSPVPFTAPFAPLSPVPEFDIPSAILPEEGHLNPSPSKQPLAPSASTSQLDTLSPEASTSSKDVLTSSSSSSLIRIPPPPRSPRVRASPLSLDISPVFAFPGGPKHSPSYPDVDEASSPLRPSQSLTQVPTLPSTSFQVTSPGAPSSPDREESSPVPPLTLPKSPNHLDASHTSPAPTPRSPSPSASSIRSFQFGAMGWHPVVPGYKSKEKPLINPQPETEEYFEDDTSLKDAIPAMSKNLAIFCFVLNVLIPGAGTFIAGQSVNCGSKVRSCGKDKLNVLWVNSWVAFLQLITTFIFFLGWVWSIMWGAHFVAISNGVTNLQVLSEENEDQNEADTTGGSTDSIISAQQPIPTVSQRVAARTSTSLHGVTATTTTTVTVHPYVPEATAAGTAANELNEANQIIVLQEAPVIIGPGMFSTPHSRRTAPPRPVNLNNHRTQRLLRRRTEEEISNMFLNPAELENIVIRNGADGSDSGSKA